MQLVAFSVIYRKTQIEQTCQVCLKNGRDQGFIYTDTNPSISLTLQYWANALCLAASLPSVMKVTAQNIHNLCCNSKYSLKGRRHWGKLGSEKARVSQHGPLCFHGIRSITLLAVTGLRLQLGDWGDSQHGKYCIRLSHRKVSTKQGGRSPTRGTCWTGTQQEPNLFSSPVPDFCPTLGRTPNCEGEEIGINKLKILANSCSGINTLSHPILCLLKQTLPMLPLLRLD